jgi:hypothetical protein
MMIKKNVINFEQLIWENRRICWIELLGFALPALHLIEEKIKHEEDIKSCLLRLDINVCRDMGRGCICVTCSVLGGPGQISMCLGTWLVVIVKLGSSQPFSSFIPSPTFEVANSWECCGHLFSYIITVYTKRSIEKKNCETSWSKNFL